MSKHVHDNRSQQLNPKDAKYWGSRGVAQPSTSPGQQGSTGAAPQIVPPQAPTQPKK